MLQEAQIQHIPSLCTPFLCFNCPHVKFIILVFTHLGCCKAVTSFSKWQPTPGGTGSRISARRALLCSLGWAAVPRQSPGTGAVPWPVQYLTQSQWALPQEGLLTVTGHGGQSSEHTAGPRDSLQEARDVSR